MNLFILWAKLFLSLSLLILLAALARRRMLPGLGLLAALFALLAVRDVAYSVFPLPLLIHFRISPSLRCFSCGHGSSPAPGLRTGSTSA